MTYGFSVSGRAGQLQIDDTFARYVYVAEGYAVTKDPKSVYAPPPEYLPAGISTAGLVFAAPPYGRFIGQSVGSSPGSFSIRTTYSDTGFNCRYFVCDHEAQNWSTPGSHGLEVFDGTGKKLFDSRSRLVYIDAVIPHQISTHFDDPLRTRTYVLPPIPAGAVRVCHCPTSVVLHIRYPAAAEAYFMGLFCKFNSDTSLTVSSEDITVYFGKGPVDWLSLHGRTTNILAGYIFPQ
jgi:hypothetical protein